MSRYTVAYVKIGQFLLQIKFVPNEEPQDGFIKDFFLDDSSGFCSGPRVGKRLFLGDFNDFSKPEQGPNTSSNLHFFLPSLNNPVLGHLGQDNSFLYFDIG